MAKGYGDRLARGGAKAAFPVSEKVSQEKFDAAFEGYDGEAFIKNAEAEDQAARERKAERLAKAALEADARDKEREERRRNADIEEAGIPGLESAQDIANNRSK